MAGQRVGWLERQVALGFVAALVTSAAIGLLTYGGLGRAEAEARWVTHSHEVIGGLQTLLAILGEAESQARAFAITGRPADRIDLEDVKVRADRTLWTLENSPSGNPPDRARIAALRPLAEQRLRALGELVAAGDRGLEEARALVREGRGAHLMDQLRAAILGIEQDQLRHLELRRQAAESRRHGTLIVLAFGVAADVAIVGMAFLTIAREMRRRRAAEREQADSEARFRSYMDHLPAATWLLDADGRCVFVNRHYGQISGYAPADLVGKSARDLYPPEIADAHRANDRRVLESDAPFEAIEDYRRPDGSTGHLLVVKFPIRDAEGRPHVGGVSLDLTERLRAESALRASEARFRGIFESSAVGMATCDADGRFREVNAAFGRIVGYEPEELVSRPFVEITHPDDRAGNLDCFARLKAGDLPWYRMEKRYVHRNGRSVPVQCSISIVRDDEGRPASCVAIVEDLTERRRAERALAVKAEELARSNAELERFAYVASHDLQEPLRMVAGFTDLLARRYAGRLDDRADRYIEHTVDGCRRMQAMIRDLLEYARVGAGDRPRVSVDLGEALRRCLHDLRPALAESGGTVTAGPLPTVLGDPIDLDRLLRNLLVNALKFRGDRPPRVHISAAREDNRGWTVRVVDNGIGVPAEASGRIFQIFQRLHTREEYPGTGLGLAVCNKVVEGLGGSIWHEAAPDGGSCFAFTLPPDDDSSVIIRPVG